jgi:hypothetical protein
MRRTWRRIWHVTGAAGAVLVLTGAASQLPRQPGPENQVAADAVAAMTAGSVPDLPADFESVMGYEPTAVTGPGGDPRLVKIGNGCSSPFGATSFDFSQACNEHDFGYDLLRYATRAGEPLQPWARKAIDAHFADTLHEQCELTRDGAGEAACDALAEAYHGAAAVNSWRQGYGNPGKEELGPWLVGGGATAAGVALIGIARRRRHAASEASR